MILTTRSHFEMDEYPKAIWSEWAERIIARYDLRKQGASGMVRAPRADIMTAINKILDQ